MYINYCGQQEHIMTYIPVLLLVNVIYQTLETLPLVNLRVSIKEK